jgi:hypothetical protein
MFLNRKQKLASTGSLLASITPEPDDCQEHHQQQQDDDIKELEKHGKRFWKRLWKANLPLYKFHVNFTNVI